MWMRLQQCWPADQPVCGGQLHQTAGARLIAQEKLQEFMRSLPEAEDEDMVIWGVDLGILLAPGLRA